MISGTMNLSSLLLFSAITIPSAFPPTSAPSDALLSPSDARRQGQDSDVAKADSSRMEGDPSAPVLLVIVQNYACTHCKTAHETMEETLRREYVRTKKIKIAYMTIGLNPTTIIAASSALCAGVQGKFLAMNDALFDAQEKWMHKRDAMPDFDTAATKAGVDMPAWRSCMTSKKMDALVNKDVERVMRLGVEYTPTFIVGEKLMVGVKLNDIRQALDAALAKAGSK
jgi:protein-disulfide isomerase